MLLFSRSELLHMVVPAAYSRLELLGALQVLPSSLETATERLRAAQQELAALDAQQAKIGRRAAWRQHGLVWGGLSSQLALWGLMYRLTFWELSWDVMASACSAQPASIASPYFGLCTPRC